MQFDGFLKLYEEGRDERQRGIEKGKDDKAAAEEEDDSRRLPQLNSGDRLRDKLIEANQHFTQPPPRFSEAKLVERMKELGIGRPSTYASTMATLVDRNYVVMDKKQLVPEDRGRLVTAFLESFFQRYVEYDYTADLEEKLDLISDHKLEWKDVLREFWREFMGRVDETRELKVSDVLDALNDLLGPHIFPDKGDGSSPRTCPKCGIGQLSLKISGKNGAFIGCSNYGQEPGCRYTRQLSPPTGNETDVNAIDGKVLGIDPESGLEVVLKNGRFGAYVQLGEPPFKPKVTKGRKTKAKDKEPEAETPAVPAAPFKRSSIPAGVDPASVELELALRLLSLPREVGVHPEDAETITAALGRFGPYVKHKGTYANLPNWEDLFSIGLNHAVTLIADKIAGKGARFGRGAQRTVLKDLGEHPIETGKVEILEGKYGPYITHNKVNANIPRGKEPADVTLEEAVALLAERVANGGGKKAKAKPKAAAKAPAAAKVAKAAANDAGEEPKKKPAAKKKAAPRKDAAE